ncbi:MAG: tyrosine-type recombinase/integrase [Lachnospiraceae bacterium]|nr:tyrosine-type recombinase/integrase [Lachnospiraceae bacterium]
MIADFLTEKKHHGRIKDKGPLSDKTVSEIKSILSRILRYAKSCHFLDEIPESVPVTVKKSPVKVLTGAERKRLETQAIKEDTPFTSGVLLCIYTGIREGEVCALKWEDFDWESGTVSIRRTVSRINDTAGKSGSKTHIVISTPKTECSMAMGRHLQVIQQN